MRGFCVILHRYIGLATALFLVLLGLTGSVLAWREPLSAWLAPDLYEAPARGPWPALRLPASIGWPSSTRSRWLLAGGLALLLAAGFAAPRLLGGAAVPVHRIVQRDFAQTVVATGHVEAPHRVTIGTVVSGNVRRVPVDEGQTVGAGQTLVELDDAEWAAAAAQADASVAQASSATP